MHIREKEAQIIHGLFKIYRIGVLFTEPRMSVLSRACLWVLGTCAALGKTVVTVVVVHMSDISKKRTTTSRQWTWYAISGHSVSKNVAASAIKELSKCNCLKESSETSRETNWRQDCVMKWCVGSQSDVDVGSRAYVHCKCIGIYYEYCSVLLPSTRIDETNRFITLIF